MKHNGWIKLHRKLLQNWVSQDPEQAWLWVTLLLLANHEESSFVFNSRKHQLLPGQVLTSRRKLAQVTGISESKIYRTTKRLEIEQQIEQQAYRNFTVITIKNWGKYQSSEPLIEQRSNHKVNTYKNYKNNNKYIYDYDKARHTIAEIRKTFKGVEHE